MYASLRIWKSGKLWNTLKYLLLLRNLMHICFNLPGPYSTKSIMSAMEVPSGASCWQQACCITEFPASLPSPSPSPQLWQYQDCQFLALSVTNLCRHELVWHYQWAIYAVMNWCYSISELFMPLWNIVTVSVTNLCRHGLVWPYQSPIYAAMK